jgi:hypothetical protein
MNHPIVDATSNKGKQSRGRRSSWWAHRIAARYGLTLPEARAELRRCAANGWQVWEFHARFDGDR